MPALRGAPDDAERGGRGEQGADERVFTATEPTEKKGPR